MRFDDEIIGIGDVMLRPVLDTDRCGIVASCQDAVLQRWLPLPNPYTTEDARVFITQEAPEMLASGMGIVRAVAHHDSFAGMISLKDTDWQVRGAEMSYWLAPWARGSGVMTRALRAFTDWALGRQGLERIGVRIPDGNVAAINVAIRCGFVHEGLLRRAGWSNAGPADIHILSRVRGDPSEPRRAQGLADAAQPGPIVGAPRRAQGPAA